MAQDRNAATDLGAAIGTGGPGLAPDFADAPAGHAEVGPARRAGNVATLSDDGLDGRTLEPAVARAPARRDDRSRALFEREDSGTRGPHMLNRAFSGTYPDKR